jgi:hypothetical protein
VVTPAYSADIRGWVGLKDGSLGLNGSIKTGAPDASALVSADATGAELAPIPAGAPEPLRFTIEGTLAEPIARAVVAAN